MLVEECSVQTLQRARQIGEWAQSGHSEGLKGHGELGTEVVDDEFQFPTAGIVDAASK